MMLRRPVWSRQRLFWARCPPSTSPEYHLARSPGSRRVRRGTCTSATWPMRSGPGAWRRPPVAECCCGSRTTTGDAAGPSTSEPSSKTWSGSAWFRAASAGCCARATRSAPTGARSSTSAGSHRSMPASAPAPISPSGCGPTDWKSWDELRYPGTCRPLRLAPGDGLGLRVTLGEEPVEFDDLRLGPQRQTPALPVRRPAAARFAGQLDLPALRGGGRHSAGCESGDPRRGPAGLHRTPDHARHAAGPEGAAALPASPAHP